MSHADRIPSPPKPPWLRRRLPSHPSYQKVLNLIAKENLHTVCQAAACPNQFECFSQHTATFMILGARCTRNCTFCNIKEGPGEPLDPDEPQRVASAAVTMKLTYVVLTSVTRDDLSDGGAGVFAATIAAIHRRLPETKIEVLIPDFKGNKPLLPLFLPPIPQY